MAENAMTPADMGAVLGNRWGGYPYGGNGFAQKQFKTKCNRALITKTLWQTKEKSWAQQTKYITI